MVGEISGTLEEFMADFFFFFFDTMQAIFTLKCLLKGCGFSYFKSWRILARPHFNSIN